MSYLHNVATVNGEPVDSRIRYAPEAPREDLSHEELSALPATTAAAEHLRQTWDIAYVSVARVPLPDAFDPADEIDDSRGGRIGVDVCLTLRACVQADAIDSYEDIAESVTDEVGVNSFLGIRPGAPFPWLTVV